MKSARWSSTLLRHALAEEVATKGGASSVLFRGPRIKVLKSGKVANVRNVSRRHG
jgi:hypothetical protein